MKYPMNGKLSCAEKKMTQKSTKMNNNEEAKPKRKWECHRMSKSEKRVIVKEYRMEGISQ